MKKVQIITQEDLQQIIFKAVHSAIRIEFTSAVRGPDYEYKSILTVREASEYLQLAKGTIYNLVSGKKIPFVKAGKMLKFYKADLEKWISESKSSLKATT